MKAQRSTGLTLIECLVALVIVAIVLASAARAIGLIVSDVHDTFVREAATWIAENEYNQYQLDGVYPDVATVKKTITSAGIVFNVTEVVSQTPNPYFRRIETSISEAKTPNYIIFKTVNFISQY